MTTPVDLVNSPPHYRQGNVECIDAIKAALGPEGFKYYCRGAIIKYLWRADHKGTPEQDIAKAAWYMQRLVDKEKPTHVSALKGE